MHTAKDLPKISIVTPSYNQGQFIEETILSVVNQNYPNLEYIVIDGGSTDNTIEVIKKYEQYITYWVSEPDSGMYEAVQKGFEKSTGEIMAWLNSDDLYHRNSFFIVAEVFSSFPKINWLTGATTYFDEHGRIVEVKGSRKWSKYQFYLGQYRWIQQESTFWTRSLWNKSGSHVNNSLRYAGDFDLWIRFFRHEKLFSTSAALGGFRLRTNNQLSLDHLDDYFTEANIVLKQEIEQLDIAYKVRMYNLTLSVLSKINKLRVINSQGLKNIVEQYLFSFPPSLSFDRRSGRFKVEY